MQDHKMVGVPRSNGCLLCVKRRVKCDQRLPACAKCEKYGEPCPGYDRGFKFVTGKPYRDRRQQPNSRDTKQVRGRPETAVDPMGMVSSFISVDMNVIQNLCALVDDFSQSAVSSPAHVVSRWFRFLPTIYGQNRVLDATIRSFTANHFGRITQNTQMVLYARSAYGAALRGLRRSLETPAEALSSHIFCAVVLLCMYELFTDTESPDSWMKHAKGLGQLARIRGPDRYNTELDMALLKASRGVIVMHAMFSGEECFLASDQWHDIMLRRFNEDLPEGLYYSIEEFFAYMTYAPDLVHKLYSLRNPGVTCAEKSQRVPELVIQALEMQTKLATWYERFSHIAPTPTETISSTGDELYPIVLTYMDVNCATIYCGYYAYMVIIHEVLRSCGYPGEHDAMVVYFRDQICKSVEYNTRGLLGPYRMGFPLRVVFEIADPVTKAWVLDRLEHLSKSYAAMRPENYKTVL